MQTTVSVSTLGSSAVSAGGGNEATTRSGGSAPERWWRRRIESGGAGESIRVRPVWQRPRGIGVALDGLESGPAVTCDAIEVLP